MTDKSGPAIYPFARNFEINDQTGKWAQKENLK